MGAVTTAPLRVAAFTALAGGVVLGSLASSVPARPVFRAGPYIVLAGDFHVHSLPGDGAALPWVMRDEARRAGLDVIAVTNHNQTIAGRLAQWVSSRSGGPIMIAGEEITGADYHLIAVGVRDRVRNDQPAARAIDAVHEQGGVAIAAHPTHVFRGWTDEAVSALDGAEVAHPVMWGAERLRQELMAFQERAERLNPRISSIGSSDVHMTRTLGICRTFVFVHEAGAAAVLDALRSGMAVAMDMRGRLYGRPDLVRLVHDRRPAGRVDAHPSLRRASIALVFAALVGMLLLGERRS